MRASPAALSSTFAGERASQEMQTRACSAGFQCASEPQKGQEYCFAMTASGMTALHQPIHFETARMRENNPKIEIPSSTHGPKLALNAPCLKNHSPAPNEPSANNAHLPADDSNGSSREDS